MAYPPGVSASTPDAPWNDKEPDDCDICGGQMTEDGHQTHEVEVDGEMVEQPCSESGRTMLDKEKDAKIDKAEMKMDEMRLNGEL